MSLGLQREQYLWARLDALMIQAGRPIMFEECLTEYRRLYAMSGLSLDSRTKTQILESYLQWQEKRRVEGRQMTCLSLDRHTGGAIPQQVIEALGAMSVESEGAPDTPPPTQCEKTGSEVHQGLSLVEVAGLLAKDQATLPSFDIETPVNPDIEVLDLDSDDWDDDIWEDDPLVDDSEDTL